MISGFYELDFRKTFSNPINFLSKVFEFPNNCKLCLDTRNDVWGNAHKHVYSFLTISNEHEYFAFFDTFCTDKTSEKEM